MADPPRASYMFMGEQQYDALLQALGPRAFRRHLAERAVADAAAEWWQDWSKKHG